MNIQERIEALETEFAEKIKTLKAEAQQEQEFPQDGDEYWYIDDGGDILHEIWDGLDFEETWLALGNVFRTKDQADFAVEKLKVEAELRRYSRPFEMFSTNWLIAEEEDGTIGIHWSSHSKSQGTLYFESDKKAQQAIDAVGEYRIKKYIFGVEGKYE